MTLGNRIKELRQANDLSQPELVEKIGIEQSYLSKLENDKSVPSNDIFKALLRAFNLNISGFLGDKDWSSEKPRLCQIPDLERWFKEKEKAGLDRQRRYLYRCSALIVIAVTFFYVGMSKQLFSETQYQYISRGVIFPDESKHIFYNWDELIDRSSKEGMQRFSEKKLEMKRRFDQQILIFNESRGNDFEIAVEGGRRYFDSYKHTQEPRRVNAWLQVLGVLLFSAGMMGFVLERKLFNSQQ